MFKCPKFGRPFRKKEVFSSAGNRYLDLLWVACPLIAIFSHSAGASMTDNQTEIQFRSEQHFRDWIAGKSREWQCAMATRVVLRALPLVFRILKLPTRELPAKKEKKLVLHTLRIALLAHATVRQGLYDRAEAPLEEAGLDIRQCSDAAQEQSAEHHLVLAAEKLANLFIGAPREVDTSAKVVRWEASTTAFIVSDILNGTSADDPDRRQLLKSISADANFLTSGGDASDLARQQLWLNDVREKPEFSVNFPDWARKAFDAFANTGIGKTSPWSEWSAWYRSILGYWSKPSSVHFSDALKADLMASTPSFWGGDPDEVMRKLAALRTAGPGAGELGFPGFAGLSSNRIRVEKIPLDLGVLRSRKARATERIDNIPPHSDQPTILDELGRRPFARALVERMERAISDGNDGLAVHLHAPWGAGKTSVLMMMAQVMTEAQRAKPQDKRWIAINFNAWQHEPRKAVWWPFLETAKSESIRQLQAQKKWWKAFRIWRKWVLWNCTKVSGPYVAPLLILSALAVAGWWITQDRTVGAVMSNLTALLGITISAAAVFGLAAMLGRIVVFGSDTGAKEFAEHTHNPLRSVVGIFNSMVKIINAPICIFIDDVDRCHGAYIVGLVGAIQSSFRHPNVSFVVAADRAWMKAAFEEQYADFADEVGSPAQPLGYLFLEKLFQISIPVPGIDPEIKRQYWERLLGTEGAHNEEDGSTKGRATTNSDAVEDFEGSIEKRRLLLRNKFPKGITQEDAEAELHDDPTIESRAALVLELGKSTAAEKQAEHLLARFVDILPDNPRVMKRMVNTFAMRRAIGILQGASVDPEALARWTILEQRFPALADKLAAQPEALDELVASGVQEGPPPLPAELSRFKGVPIMDLIGRNEDVRLTSIDIRRITMGARN